MESKLVLYNTLTRRKEVFEPLVPGRVGMYVCGPTVYGDPHLGHARPAVTFDLLFRYLKACGYKVRYVRNITDVGHLEHDADEGEDKIAKKARLEQLEPMEVAHYYTERYHRAMDALNVETPSIEPYASGHIIEQIERVPVTYLKYIEGTNGLFEIRVQLGSDIFRIFCFFDGNKMVVLLCGFQKKTQKTPPGEIKKAEKIMSEYYDEKRKETKK